jgi:hypothetical protein
LCLEAHDRVRPLELVAEFHNSPYTFLYESDLPATLFAKLRASLPERIVVPAAAVETCKPDAVDPFAYLCDLLEKLPTWTPA